MYICQSLVEYEMKMWSEIARRNSRAKRLPARKRKLMYGKAKLPYTVIHDCIEVNGRESTKGFNFKLTFGVSA